MLPPISPLADQQYMPVTLENAGSVSSKWKGRDVSLANLNPRTIDEMMRCRARLTPDLAHISYPSSDIDYVNYTSLQLDIFAFRAARHYALYLPPRSSSIEQPRVIGLLGPSDFNFIITMFPCGSSGTLCFSYRQGLRKRRMLLYSKLPEQRSCSFMRMPRLWHRGFTTNSLIFESRNSLARARMTTP
jgi:hypothetical protein